MKKYRLTLTEDIIKEIFNDCGDEQIDEKEFIVTGVNIDEEYNEVNITLIVE